MTKHIPTSRDITEAPTSSSLVRSKRTSPNDDIDDTWNDDEENDDPAVTASSTKRAVQPDPIKEALACRANIAKLKRDHNEGLYVELGRVTLIARGFDRNKKSWARFVKRSFWGKAREQDRPHVGHEKRSKIAFVTRFVFKPRTPNQFKRTSKFSGVLEFILEKGVKPENMARELKKRKIGKTHRLVTKKPRPSGRKNEKPTDPVDIVEKRPHGNDRPRKKAKCPIFLWDKKTAKAMKKHNKVGARGRLDFKVVEPKNGRTRYKVVEVTERK
jgi:hypothetical protein